MNTKLRIVSGYLLVAVAALFAVANFIYGSSHDREDRTLIDYAIMLGLMVPVLVCGGMGFKLLKRDP